MQVTAFLETFGQWVQAQPDVKAAALVGSYARNAATAQSDIDLILLTTEVVSYFQRKSWLTLFGEVEEYKGEDWGRVKTLRAFYNDGTEIEYNFSTPDWSSIPVDDGTHRVVADGMNILFDPHHLLETLQQAVVA